MVKREDLTGRKFGMLTVLRWHHVNDEWQHFWECVCECENTSVVHGSKLRSGYTKSCGCYKKLFSKTHGQSGKLRTPEYIAWGNMVQRCNNPNNNNYKRYGARGIKVCDSWLMFDAFLADMGVRPSSKHSIERKANDGNYYPDNCLWEIRSVQERNKRTNVILEHNGRTQVLLDWAKELGVKYPTIKYHLRNGKSFEWVYNRFKNK